MPVSAAARKAAETQIDIQSVTTQAIDVAIIGTQPLILNRMPEKASREILLPGGRKTAAARQATLKHCPPEEFRAAPYRFPEEEANTLLAFMGAAFRRAMATAALDLPGAKKAQVARLVWVEGYKVEVYGIPELFMSVVRCADINRTPDIRTRVIIPQWAVPIQIQFVESLITARSVLNLLSTAGVTVGVGDWRTEKGSGRFGSFRVANPDDPEAIEIMRRGGRDAQQKAMDAPDFYDTDSQDLFEWWQTEVAARGFNEKGQRVKAGPFRAARSVMDVIDEEEGEEAEVDGDGVEA